jgi:hypothetical protein
VLFLRRTPQRDDGRVLEQEEHIFLELPSDAPARHLPLKIEPPSVRNDAQVLDPQLVPPVAHA